MKSKTTHTQRLGLAQQYHTALPRRIRRYLNERRIPDTIIDHHLIGWTGKRISIPVFGQEGELVLFRFAKDPRSRAKGPKILTERGKSVTLYGWERVREKPRSLVICEGEFDRLVLEGQGIAAITSTGGAGTFLPEWAKALRSIPTVYICFDRDKAGRAGARRVSRLIPRARVVKLPKEVGKGGDVTDFFVRLRRSRNEFLTLLGTAAPLDLKPEDLDADGASEESTPTGSDPAVQRLKKSVRLEELAGEYLDLQSRGWRHRARCPFHDDRTPSFVVFPNTQTFYCFGCHAHGDVISFLMRIEHLTLQQTLEVLRAYPSGS